MGKKSTYPTIAGQHAPDHAEDGADEIDDALDVNALANTILAAYEYDGFWWFCNNWGPANLIGNTTSGSGIATWNNRFVRPHTGATINSYVTIFKLLGIPPTLIPWSKYRRWKAFVTFDDVTNVDIHIVMGRCPNSGLNNTDRHIGFRVIVGQLFASVGSGVAQNTKLVEFLGGGEYRELEVVWTPDQTVKGRFYVDGVQVWTVGAGDPLPEGTTDAERMLTASIYNRVAADKELHLYELRSIIEP